MAAALEPFGAQQSGEAPIFGPEPRPDDLPGKRGTGRQRGERTDSTTIAGLLAEALAAYQATADDDDDYAPRAEPEPRFEPFDTFADYRQQSGVTGRHRSPE